MPETKQKKPIYKKWWFWVIALIILGAIGSAGDDTQEADKPKETQEVDSNEETTEEPTEKETEPELSPEEEKIEYIAQAKEFDYKELERNPDTHKGEIAKFKGQVIQVSEGILDNVVYRVNVTKNPDYSEDSILEDEWIDTIYVSYKRAEGESRVLEDDIITIYGELDGMETYTSVMAGKISIPSIKAKYIDIE